MNQCESENVHFCFIGLIFVKKNCRQTDIWQIVAWWGETVPYIFNIEIWLKIYHCLSVGPFSNCYLWVCLGIDGVVGKNSGNTGNTHGFPMCSSLWLMFLNKYVFHFPFPQNQHSSWPLASTSIPSPWEGVRKTGKTSKIHGGFHKWGAQNRCFFEEQSYESMDDLGVPLWLRKPPHE